MSTTTIREPAGWRRPVTLAGAALVLAFASLWVVGGFVPTDHTAAVSARLEATPDAVWALIADRESGPRWRSNIDRVEWLETSDGYPTFREHSGGDAMSFRILESIPRRKLVTEIADQGLPFGGRWVHQLAPDGAGTLITVTEYGEIYSAPFRTLSRFVFGYTGTLETYATDMASALGEPTVAWTVSCCRP